MSKNLDVEIVGEIPKTGRMRSLRTVTASTMITPIEIVGQGWTSQCSLWKLAWIGIGERRLRAYNIAMEISLAPEVEARLAKIASDAGKAADQVVQELVASYVDHDEWFKREVQKGLDSLDGGKFVSHEEVGRQIERILRP